MTFIFMSYGTKHITWDLENAQMFIELANLQGCCREQRTECV